MSNIYFIAYFHRQVMAKELELSSMKHRTDATKLINCWQFPMLRLLDRKASPYLYLKILLS